MTDVEIINTDKNLGPCAVDTVDYVRTWIVLQPNVQYQPKFACQLCFLAAVDWATET
jgi:Pyruvate/2-oxoacid:ferredoxin oxidoreductase delta subunit